MNKFYLKNPTKNVIKQIVFLVGFLFYMYMCTHLFTKKQF